GEKNDAARKYEALGESGKKTLRDLRGEDSLACHSAAHRAQCRLCSPRRGPIALHERAHGTDRAEKLRASADGEPHIRELCHIGIGARSGLSQHDLFEIRSELRPRGGRPRQLIRSGFNIARPPQYRRWPSDCGDAWVALT